MKTLISFLLLVSAAIAQNNTGTLVIAPVRPQASNDTFPSAIANEIKGGPFTATNLTGLSNIPAERLTIGSLGYAESTGLYYRLTSTSPVTWAGIDGANFTNVGTTVTFPIAVTNGGTGSTNAAGTNTSIVNVNGGVRLGAGVVNITAGAAIGSGANVSAVSIFGGAAVGKNTSSTDRGGAIGDSATTGSGGAAGGSASSSSGGAIGFTAVTGQGGAAGANSISTNGFAGGLFARALASLNVQLGTGTNTNNNTIQFLSAGAVDTNEWSALANASTLGQFALTNTSAETFRNEIGLGATNTPTFSNLIINGNLTNNGTIYGLKTNVGPFEGIGNFFASNNTTLSNETLFRVGVAEATNRSAQFGFRVARTNNGGEGFAVFSVYGYNALMMIGPSDRSRSNYATNTNAGIEATLWTITPTNRVMTLRDTNTGATTLHQSLGFDTNVTSTAPADTTNIVKWIEVWVGTNSYRMPLYQ